MIGCARSHLRMRGSAGAGHPALNGRAARWTFARLLMDDWAAYVGGQADGSARR